MKTPGAANRRQYVRIDTVLPVQFRIVSTKGVMSDWIQGFTNNIGKGGICLRVNYLKGEIRSALQAGESRLSLEIETPFTKSEVVALACVSWVQDIDAKHNKYLIGLIYERIESSSNARLMRYVWMKKLFVPVAVSCVVLLAAIVAFNSYVNMRLAKGNKALVEQLVKILQESVAAKQRIKDINKEKEGLQLKMQTLAARIQTVEEEKRSLVEGTQLEQNELSKRLDNLDAQIKQLLQQKAPLQEQLVVLQNKESAIAEELFLLNKSKVILQKANFDQMYQWLVIHQNPRTGLVASFEGDMDLANWAFTYDQSLAAQAYVQFSDFDRAKSIFEFFARKAKRREGLFLNAYYVTDGSPVEYVLHSGPNIWVGIAIAQYIRRSQDNRYLRLAEEIAQAVINLQDKDGEGGVRGGPGLSWYSTEHNLDAYAFFDMLYTITTKQKYRESRDKVLNWLLKHTYDKSDIPIIRGKGDSTIATDTYAWMIAAIGPKKLEELNMNPEKMVEFAEQNCGVEVSYVRPGGEVVKIKGFDFAAQRHIARGGVISTEWTAQMILAFKLMADYYHAKGMDAKARTYEIKAEEYLFHLCAMIISSPSPSGQGEGCLPYASSDSVDTGHGWITPKGVNTGSVAATVYTLFSYYKYNPLELKEQ